MTFKALAVFFFSLSLCLAQTQPENSPLREKIYRHQDFYTKRATQGLARTSLSLPESFRAIPQASRIHPHTKRFDTLVLSAPLPLGENLHNLSEAQIADGVIDFLSQHRDLLNIEIHEISDHLRISKYNEGKLIGVHAARHIAGIPVRGAFLNAIISHGKMILLGTQNWGDPQLDLSPTLDVDTARQIAGTYSEPFQIQDDWDLPQLTLIVLDHPQNAFEHRLAWSLRPLFNEPGRFEVLVDAHNGELIAFQDTAHYTHDPALRGTPAPRTVSGSVLPLNNDGSDPTGVQQSYPMPFVDLHIGDDLFYTDSGGNLPYCLDGEAMTALQGLYAHVNNGCGLIEESSLGDLDLGTHSGSVDCDVPIEFSAGNSLAARTAYYEVNRMAEIARAHLPNNDWLHQEKLQINVNIEPQCNAFATANSVNFYSAMQNCGNSAYFAGIIAHEWAHAMDHNDGTSGMSNPSEGIADAIAALRLNTSCIGENYLNTNCSSYGDDCTDCTGVRDIDWNKRESGLPHDISWVTANCPTGSDLGPCGTNIYCESAVYAEAIWDLYTIDLPNFYGFDEVTARELTMRLTVLGSGGVSDWYQCTQGEGGCLSDSGYLNFLAADDDDGDLGNGTPHMQAIYAAFNRHGIACSALTVTDSGCDDTPTVAPSVIPTPLHQSVQLTWNAVTNADAYRIYRGEGVTNCDRAKVIVGEIEGTEFIDTGLRNGRTYHYTVVPMGTSDSCLGPGSNCISVVPETSAALKIQPKLEVAFDDGDGDRFIDNCESVRLTLTVDNIGSQAFTDVQIVGLQSSTHPDTQMPSLPILISEDMPGSCGTGQGTFSLRPRDLLPGQTFQLSVEIGSNDLFPETITEVFEIPFGEQDLVPSQNLSFDFQTDNDGWTQTEGSFTRQQDPKDEDRFYMQSSAEIDNTCDALRSPVMLLSATSTLTFDLFYDIDLPEMATDRASVAIINLNTGVEIPIQPDGGASYDISGLTLGGFCGNGQSGWAGTLDDWSSTSFSATALSSGNLTDTPIQIEIRNGTDYFRAGTGLRIDNVQITEARLFEADAQSDDGCGPNCLTLTYNRWPEHPITEYVLCENEE